MRYKLDHGQVAAVLMNHNEYTSIEETGDIYYFENGILKNADSLIDKETEKYIHTEEKEFGFVNSDAFTKEVKGHIRRRSYIKRNQIDKDPNIFNLKNGFFDMKSGILLEHNAAYPSLIQLPITYDEKAKCPKFIKFLTEVQPNESERQSILEEMAYCLLRHTKHQKAFLHVGEGANGKSVYFYVLDALFGCDNISHISLDQIQKNRFCRANLDGKLINTFSEISSEEIKYTAHIKAIITGDPFEVEQKGKTGYTMKPTVKIICSCNRLPEINNDQSNAWFRRWTIRQWNETFTGEKEDKRLIEKLTTPEELSGIFNLLYPIAIKLNTDGEFSDSPSAQETKAEWLEKADIIQSYINKNLKIDSYGIVTKNKIYDSYCDWCRNKSYAIKARNTFFTKLREKIRYDDSTTMINGKEQKVLRGISLKDSDSPTSSTTSTGLFNYENIENSDNKEYKKPVEADESVDIEELYVSYEKREKLLKEKTGDSEP